MDDNTGWSLLCAFAILVAGALAGWALSMTPQQYARGWVFIASSSPLIMWLLAWAAHGNSNDHWRRMLALGIGVTVGPAVCYGLAEVVAYHSRKIDNSKAVGVDRTALASNESSNKTAIVPQSADGNKVILYAQCRDVSPQSASYAAGTVNYLTLEPNSLRFMTGGFNILSADKGETSNPFIFSNAYDVFRCELINYSSTPMFNVRFTLDILFIKEGGTDYARDALASISYPVVADRIENDPKNPFVFWILNVSRLGGYVDIVPEIKYDVPGERKTVSAIINQPLPRRSRMVFTGSYKASILRSPQSTLPQRLVTPAAD